MELVCRLWCLLGIQLSIGKVLGTLRHPSISQGLSAKEPFSRYASIQFLKPECVEFSDQGRNVHFVFHCEAARVRVEFMMARMRAQADAIEV